MQIFSKLQRNSAYYIFIILLAILNSNYIFFPVLLGVVFLCFNLIEAIIYIAVFSILHSYNIFYFEFFYLFYYFYLKNKILDFFDKDYFDVIVIFVVYFVYFLYLIQYEKLDFIFVYLIYNLSFDLILSRILKCKLY